MTEKKKEYLLKNFQLSADIVSSIENLCDNMLGTDKYAIWMGKEAKKDQTILSYEKLQEIIDWAQSTGPNILAMNYSQALEEAKKYHEGLKGQKLKKANETINSKRVLFKCSDGKHFFYSLKPRELKREGNLMGNCVGSNELYAKKLRNGLIKIISLRDDKNLPHVTCEINMVNGESVQIKGKENQEPISKYLNFISEFGIWAAGDNFTEEEKNKLNELMKIHKK